MDTKQPHGKTNKNEVFVALAVSLLTFLVYFPALQNDFLNWDDDVYVTKNPNIRSFDAKLIRWAFISFYDCNWFPLTLISHAIDYAVWGGNPIGHHFTNNILHATNTFWVVLLSIKLALFVRAQAAHAAFFSKSSVYIIGAGTGLLFGLHPLHVESVAWASQRKDLLCAIFYLLSIYAHLNYARPQIDVGCGMAAKSERWYYASIVFFVLALLSKPMAVSLPFTLTIIDFYPLGRIKNMKSLKAVILEKIPFIVLALASSTLTILAQRSAMMPLETVPLSTRFYVAASAVLSYLGKMLLPINLIPYYPYPQDVSLLSLVNLLPIIIVAGSILGVLIYTNKNRLLFSIWSYYLITLLPVLGIIQVGSQAMADRYTYLPSIGPFMFISVMAAKLYDKIETSERFKMVLTLVAVAVSFCLVFLMSYATVRQIGLWKNNHVFWHYVIEKSPVGVHIAHYNLGNHYKAGNRLDLAIEQYRKALILKPDFELAYNNMGNAYYSLGMFNEAIEQYKKALIIKADYAEAYFNMGNSYYSLGLLDPAIEQYRKALTIKPDYSEAYNNMGLAYENKFRLIKAP